MSFLDARTLPDGVSVETEVCIVGAGAAGITIALELNGAPFRVALIESGGLRGDAASQTLLRTEAVGPVETQLDRARLSGFGGTTAVWNGACRPLDEIDFLPRDWVPHSGWPFPKAHLNPYYARAQSLCQLGPYRYELDAWQQNGAPPLPLSARRISTHIFQISPPTRFGRVYRRAIFESPNIDTYLYGNVVEIETNDDARLTAGVRVATSRGTRFRVAAQVVVLAAGGIETPRLLLLSNRLKSFGLGNEHDLVGRFFSDHLRIESAVLVLKDGPRYRPMYSVRKAAAAGQAVAIEGVLALGDEVLEQEKMVRCGFHIPARWRSFPEFQSDGVTAAREVVRAIRLGNAPYRWPRRLQSIARELNAVLLTGGRRLMNGRDDGRFGLIVTAYTEQAPNPDSRVALTAARDSLGRQKVRLDWRVSEIDLWTIRRATEVLAEEVGRAELGDVQIHLDGKEWQQSPRLRGGFHHMGTTRLHPSPTQGVADTDGQVHGVANLFIASSAVFPTGGYANPTLTIVALAVRLADHIRGLWR